jgi:uncharacterized protein
MPANKHALVTGSASGIGLEMAHLLAKRGYHLLMVDINQTCLQKLKPEFESAYNIKIETITIDLSKHDAAKSVFEFCESNQIEVEVLINNAGIFFFSEVPETDISNASDLIGLHINTSTMLTVYFSKKMKARGRGFILFVSSISAYKDFPGIAFYASSKSFIKSFARSLRTELKYYNINVTTVFPGATATNLYDTTAINVALGKKLGIFADAKTVAAAGINALFKNKATVIPGFVTKVLLLLAVITPQWIIYLLRKKYRKLF